MVAVNNFFARSVRVLIPCSPAFKMTAHTSTSPDPVSNSTLLKLKKGEKKKVVKG